jgi:hypothetical protein
VFLFAGHDLTHPLHHDLPVGRECVRIVACRAVFANSFGRKIACAEKRISSAFSIR